MRRLALVLSFLASTAAADDIGSVAGGETLAREVCAACHSVDLGQTSTDPAAPAFAEIADLVSTTQQSLFVFLSTSHPTMPNMILERRETDDLIAYILSLRDR